jgi:YbbR domain-containing protein
MNLRPKHPLQFAVALLAACLLWYAWAGQRGEEISVRGVRAQLTLVNIPRDLVLISSVPDTVAVQLRGPLSRAIDPRNTLEVLLDLSNARPGPNTFPINGSDIPLPPEVEVVSVEPAAMTLELERRRTRFVPLRLTLEGVPAPGFVLGEILIVPAQITVQGPESRIADLEFVETTSISIEGASGPVEGSVQPQLVDPLVRSLMVVPAQVVVEVVPEPSPTPTPTP